MRVKRRLNGEHIPKASLLPSDEAAKTELRASAPAFQPSDPPTSVPHRSSRDTSGTKTAEPTPKAHPGLKALERASEGSKALAPDAAAAASANNAPSKQGVAIKQEPTTVVDAAAGNYCCLCIATILNYLEHSGSRKCSACNRMPLSLC